MSLLAVFAAEEHELAPLIMDSYWFAVIPAALFIFLGLVVWSFRDVANRHSHKTGSAPHGTDHH
ncbi:MAG: hypothetical protein JWP30_291 [Homoserinimonas sp.]|jgi:hypothetical protein|nr:hypothetical protein [Homoserinimonas sp.]